MSDRWPVPEAVLAGALIAQKPCSKCLYDCSRHRVWANVCAPDRAIQKWVQQVAQKLNVSIWWQPKGSLLFGTLYGESIDAVRRCIAILRGFTTSVPARVRNRDLVLLPDAVVYFSHACELARLPADLCPVRGSVLGEVEARVPKGYTQKAYRRLVRDANELAFPMCICDTAQVWESSLE